MDHYCLKINNYNLNFFNVTVDLENQIVNPDSFNVHGSIDLRIFSSFLKKTLYYSNKLELNNENLNSDFIDLLESYELTTNILLKKESLIKISSYLIRYDILRSSSWVLSFLKQIKEFVIEDELEFLLKYLDFAYFIYYKFSNYTINIEKKEEKIIKLEENDEFDELDTIYDNMGIYLSDSEDYYFEINI